MSIAAIVAAVLLALSAAARAEPQFDATAIVGRDLIQAPVALPPAWASGVLRVVISGPGEPASWNIHIDYGEGHVLILDPVALAARTVRQGPEGLTVDLPIPGAATSVSANSIVGGVRIRPTNVLSISTIVPQQMIEGSHVRPLGDGSSAQEKAYAMAFGRLDVMDGNNGLLGVCTAFRVAQGYWLTAAHCVYRNAEEPSAARMVRWRLQPDHFAKRLEGPVLYAAVPVASGLLSQNITSASLLQSTDHDYVLLKVASDPGGPALPLSAGPAPIPTTKLELLQHWKGEFSPPPGKAVSDDCMVREHMEPDDYSRTLNCPYTLQHTCSSFGGGSGGALIAASSFQLVGLHYRAGKDGKFNCATPVATIANDLCQRNPITAGKVLTCSLLVTPPKP